MGLSYLRGTRLRVAGKSKSMTTLEREKRRMKWVGVLLLFTGALTGAVLAFAVVSTVQKGVDPLEARLSALERTVAELQDERRP